MTHNPLDPSRLDKHYTHIYGWEEQNESSWGVHTLDFDTIPGEDGILFAPGLGGLLIHHDLLPPGCWYLTFGEAKRAAIKHWKEQLSIAKAALAHLNQQKETQ